MSADLYSCRALLIFLPESPADEAVRSATRNIDMIVDFWPMYCSLTEREDSDAWL